MLLVESKVTCKSAFRRPSFFPLLSFISTDSSNAVICDVMASIILGSLSLHYSDVAFSICSKSLDSETMENSNPLFSMFLFLALDLEFGIQVNSLQVRVECRWLNSITMMYSLSMAVNFTANTLLTPINSSLSLFISLLAPITSHFPASVARLAPCRLCFQCCLIFYLELSELLA